MKVVTELLAVGFLDSVRMEVEALVMLLEINKGHGSDIDLRAAKQLLESIDRKTNIVKEESFAISEFIKGVVA